MKLSEGTKKLIYLVIAVLIGVGAYFLVISPTNEEKEQLETQVTTLETRYKDLVEKQKNEEVRKQKLKLELELI